VRQPLARTFTLQRALLAVVSIAILAGMVPAGFVLDRRLAAALDERARADLALAPRVLADRRLANADAMMMHAKDFSHLPGLAEALARNDRSGTLAVVEPSRAALGNVALVIGPDGRSWTGPPLDSALVAETRVGKMPVTVRRDGHAIQNVALAPVLQNGRWVGAVGLVAPVDANAAGVLSGLTRSDVIIVDAGDGMVAASTLDSAATREIVEAERGWLRATAARELVAAGRTRLVIAAPLGNEGTVLFTRALDDEFAVLPDLRRVAFLSALAALVLALVLGALLATRVARPVRQLSDAAAAVASGEFGAPLPDSRIREVARVANTFDTMRQALAARLAELRGANDALSDRNARLTALQADLMQRDRLAATGRLVTQLAHEIRNPVANLRNCLELIRRRVDNDPEAREFTDLAIDELLRMHELAEQMLDMNRPRDPYALRCLPALVAREVATLSTLGRAAVPVLVRSHDADNTEAALAPDALKQVLLNLVQNARDAFPGDATDGAPRDARIDITIDDAEQEVQIMVEDNGPGIPPQILPRIFDPFFTTKGAVHGVGLGLFVAEGLVRTAGGRLSAGNRDGGGAWFRIDLPRVSIAPANDLSEPPMLPDHLASPAAGRGA
jgi:signal transduction histidine kinase